MSRNLIVVAVFCLVSVSLIGCSSGTSSNEPNGGGVPAPLNHKASECVQISGYFVKHLSNEHKRFQELRTDVITGGVELTVYSVLESHTKKFVFDGRSRGLPENPPEVTYKGACMGNALRLDYMLNDSVLSRAEYILEGKKLTMNYIVVDRAKLPDGENESVTMECEANCL